MWSKDLRKWILLRGFFLNLEYVSVKLPNVLVFLHRMTPVVNWKLEDKCFSREQKDSQNLLPDWTRNPPCAQRLSWFNKKIITEYWHTSFFFLLTLLLPLILKFLLLTFKIQSRKLFKILWVFSIYS